jgi:protein farnesyltransferase subunit beta
MEAHGGYSFCGLASLMLMGKGHLCNLDAVLKWAANRQMRVEGGFQGRTNKLVDSCYSFWQGGIFPLLHELLKDSDDTEASDFWLFDHRALQEYLLVCCQDGRGGLVDKPGKSRDYYHTCYGLSGLSVAQNMPDGSLAILGDASNLLIPTHPLFNVSKTSAQLANEYFNQLPVPAGGS